MARNFIKELDKYFFGAVERMKSCLNGIPLTGEQLARRISELDVTSDQDTQLKRGNVVPFSNKRFRG